MKKLILLGALLAPISVSCAQETPVQNAAQLPTKAEKLATKTLFAEGFGEAQGLALQIVLKNELPQTSLLVADYKRGEIVRLSRDGKTREVLAKDLKSPAQIVAMGETIYVTERKANRVIKIDAKGKITPLGGEIEEPLGLWGGSENELKVVSHTTSKIFAAPSQRLYSAAGPIYEDKKHPSSLPFGKWSLKYQAPSIEGAKYGFRNIVQDGQTIFLTDEDAGAVLMISPGGFTSKFAEGIEDPSGIVIHNDSLFVTDESNGGRLWQIDKNGAKKIVAEGLGRPRGVVFIEPTVALVSDRGGKIWRVELA